MVPTPVCSPLSAISKSWLDEAVSAKECKRLEVELRAAVSAGAEAVYQMLVCYAKYRPCDPP